MDKSEVCHVTQLALDQMDLDPNQPRKLFSGLDDLAQSMKETGQICPIVVRPRVERYTIVSGERRYRAAQLLGWKDIHVEVKHITEHSAFLLSLAENVQRLSLTPIEEARAFQRCLDHSTLEQLGKRIGRDRSYVTHKLRLLHLPQCLTSYLENGLLTESHIRQLLRLRAIYGGSLLCRKLKGSKEEDVPQTPGSIAQFLCLLRPEDQTPWWFFEDLERIEGPISDACLDLCRHLDDTGELPQWIVAAFWWASSIVYLDLPVAAVKRLIDEYRERLLSASLWMEFYGQDSPKGRLDEILLSGYKSDLRHCGVRTFEELPRNTQLDAVGTGMWYPPSIAMPWGTAHKEYIELTKDL